MAEPRVISVGSTVLTPVSDMDSDPRGIIWCWEDPRPNATYFLGVDTAIGITGWDRSLRTQSDIKIDNAVVQVLRRGRGKLPDVQVAEFAAPIDHYELAGVVNFMGRLYCGDSEDGQAQASIEMNNGGFA